MDAIGHRLSALSLANPTMDAIFALTRHAGPTLEHLSLEGGNGHIDTEVEEVEGSHRNVELHFLALRSLKIRRMPYWGESYIFLYSVFQKIQVGMDPCSLVGMRI